MTSPDPTGRQKGGLARAESLSPERRAEIAAAGAAARWGRPGAKAAMAASTLKNRIKVADIAVDNLRKAVKSAAGALADLDRATAHLLDAIEAGSADTDPPAQQ